MNVVNEILPPVVSYRKGIGSHQSANMKNDEWLTPPHILEALGQFDLDPCAPIVRPWNTANSHFTIETDGLKQNWFGRVWCNPPYGLEAAKWLNKLVKHGNGIALIFARTETKMFFNHVWNKADALLFIEGRLFFLSCQWGKGKSQFRCTVSSHCLWIRKCRNVENLQYCW